MPAEIVRSSPKKPASIGIGVVPTLVANAGENASRRFVEFFTTNIRNKDTRFAYAQAIRQFCGWCDEHGFELKDLQPLTIAGDKKGPLFRSLNKSRELGEHQMHRVDVYGRRQRSAGKWAIWLAGYIQIVA